MKSTLIDRVQDRYGHTVFRHDNRECIGCDAPGGWHDQPEPQLVDHRQQVLDPLTDYQITEMMEGVVQDGTAIGMRDIGKPIAGKTGTTNEAKDVWFIGFSPDLVVGLYVGYDKPRSLGSGKLAQAAYISVPIAHDFIKLALADKPATPFKVPAGIKLVRVDPKTGMRANPGQATILEAFKPGTAPPDGYSEMSEFDPDRGPISQGGVLDAGPVMRPGTGGLY